MKRFLLTGALLLSLSACQLPPERVPLQRLPENGPPLPYAELLTRARAQATVATEAFYVNRWADLEDAAAGLEQTARFLKVSEEYRKAPAVARQRMYLESMERALGGTDKVLPDIVDFVPLRPIERQERHDTCPANDTLVGSSAARKSSAPSHY